tara:strand:- start:678 stop:911 length:234 start_codon:yes stop_codon:yes gene_type:complete
VVGDESDDDFFNYLGNCRDIKKRLEEKNIEISFETRDNRKVCILKEGPFKMGVMGDTPEKAFLEAANWVLMDSFPHG